MPTEKQLAALAAGRAKLARLAAAAGMTPQRYARTHRRQITLGEAQRAFNKFYDPSTKFIRGPRKGQARFKSPRGVKAARTYDLNHTVRPDRIVTDTRYLLNPGRWDFVGVDTGPKVRKGPTEGQLRVRQALANRRRKVRPFKYSAQAPEFRPSAEASKLRPKFRLNPQAPEFVPRGIF